MVGTLINVAAIFIGGFLGVFFGSKIPERFRHTVTAGLGLFTLGYGLKMFLDTTNSLIVLGSLIVGAVVGELLGIEEGLKRLGIWLEKKFQKNVDDENEQARFVKGFLTASLLFCIGPMAILGSIQDGLSGDYQTLAIKSVLDGFAALAFASTLGVGTIFSALPLFVYQGGITLLAVQFEAIMTDAMMVEMSATGGVILMGIAIGSLLEIKKIRAGSFLPALVIAPFLVWLLTLLNII